MGFCGGSASKQQTETYQDQKALSNVIQQQAGAVMGFSSDVFKDMFAAFAPIVKAGINQEGYDAATMARLKSSAITQTGLAARNVLQSVRQGAAAYGGGNIALPSGARIGAELGAANYQAAQGAQELSNIEQQSQQLGRQNFFQASQILGGTPSEFSTALQGYGVASGALGQQANTANAITQAQNQPGWGMGILGAAGGIMGGLGSMGVCWIAAALYGGWNEPRTVLVRKWLTEVYAKTRIGSIVMRLYLRFGERVAEYVKRSDLLDKIFRPLFDRALSAAKAYYKE